MITIQRLIVLFLLMIWTSPLVCFAKTYPYRDVSCPVLNHNGRKIFVLSPTRSGSMLTFMVLQYLYETGPMSPLNMNSAVTKLHDCTHVDRYLQSNPQKQIKIVFTIRDPWYSFLSLVRVNLEKDQGSSYRQEEFYVSLAEKFLRQYGSMKKQVEDLKQDPRIGVLVIRYEQFNTNLNHLMNCISDFMGDTIPDHEKKRIHTYFSRQSVFKKTKTFKSFKDWDRMTGIHGRHIAEKPYTERDLLPAKLIPKLKKQFSKMQASWGYPTQ